LSSPDSTPAGAQVSAAEPPLLVTVDHVPESARDVLLRCSQQSKCRLYQAVEGRPQAFVIAGYPEDLARFRTLLVPVKALDFVGEAVEARLDGATGLENFPRLTAELYRKTEVAEELPVAPGTTLLVSREFTFDAAHNLPRYHGKCERLHGHTFKVRVTVKAPLDSWSGMAFDFHDLKRTVEARVVAVLDHSYVNEIVPNPSAEYIAVWIWERLSDLPMHEVKVWETPTCFVTYNGPPGRSESR
jgi:6-pyruvoyltetrahydropterin/6-carboxytetrahydropterin synthase